MDALDTIAVPTLDRRRPPAWYAVVPGMLAIVLGMVALLQGPVSTEGLWAEPASCSWDTSASLDDEGRVPAGCREGVPDSVAAWPPLEAHADAATRLAFPHRDVYEGGSKLEPRGTVDRDVAMAMDPGDWRASPEGLRESFLASVDEPTPGTERTAADREGFASFAASRNRSMSYWRIAWLEQERSLRQAASQQLFEQGQEHARRSIAGVLAKAGLLGALVFGLVALLIATARRLLPEGRGLVLRPATLRIGDRTVALEDVVAWSGLEPGRTWTGRFWVELQDGSRVELPRTEWIRVDSRFVALHRELEDAITRSRSGEARDAERRRLGQLLER